MNSSQETQSQNLSRLDTSRLIVKNIQLSSSKNDQSLRQHTENFERSIKIALVKAKRNSHVTSRRNVRIY